MTEFKSLCLYCGSAQGHNPVFHEAARYLGREFAHRGIRLVYGGGHIGLMGLAADAALEAGGTVIGVIPKFLIDAEVGHAGATELVVVESMHERKQRMFELADGFVILPGGLGTIDEMIEMITWKQLHLHDKPVVVIDLQGYWGALLGLVDHIIAEGFARPQVKNLFSVVKTVDEVFAALAAAPPARIHPAPGRT
jgi:uncharacterized protein (TIGR00730 family)